MPLTHVSDEQFLGAFAKLRKATTSLAMSVSPHGTTRLPLDGFLRNFIFEYFWKICREIQVSLKYDNNNGYLTRRPMNISYHISLSSS